ncbi:MAG: nucleotide exchange factor GrpE [Candidatus Saccharimonadales bacterium]
MPNKKDKKPSKEIELQQQADDLVADLQRARADYTNFRRRSEEEKGQIKQIVKEEVVSGLLPVIDDLKRTLGHIPKELKDNEWAKGVAQTAKQADSALKNMGVEAIPGEGEEFNPELHEAINFEDGDLSTGAGQEAIEIVSEELRAGYRLDGKVIRPSMVKVKKVNKFEKKEKK